MNSAGEILALLDKHAMPATAVTRIGLSPQRVRELAAREAERARKLTPEETRRAIARVTRRGSNKWGRAGLPEFVVRTMYADYVAGKSCREVAAIYGGTRQSVFDVFKSHGLKLRPRHEQLLEPIIYDGRKYTPMHDGYYRTTIKPRKFLHHQIWEDANGPIADGWQVSFRNGDKSDFRLDNLFYATIADVARYHHQRHVQQRQEKVA